MARDRRMKIFLTGGTGYIGGVVAKRLAADGHQLACLARSSSKPEAVQALRDLGAKVYLGGLSDRESLRPGMLESNWVVHAAAELNQDAAMEEANLVGSENVASLAVELEIPRFLSVSSMAYWGGSPADGSPGTEDSPVQDFPTAYSATKNAGELAIRKYCQRGLNVVTMHPSLVYGPPGKKNGANFFLYQVVHQKLPALMAADRLTSWVFVDDVVEAMVRVVDQDLIDGRYLLAGEGITLEDLATRLCRLSGAKIPKVHLSVPVAKTLLHLVSPFYRIAGKRLPVEPVRLDYLAKHWNFSDAKAQRDLDWMPRGLDEGLPPTVEMLLGTKPEFETV